MGIASQASIALENAQLHQDLLARERLKRDLELAREVQRSFLPLQLPEVPGYEFFAHYESAQEVGGDYYDFIPLPQQRWRIMLGDVAGKGVAAALLMAKFSAEARFCMLTEPEPGRRRQPTQRLMHASGLTDRFVTLAAAVLDPNTPHIHPGQRRPPVAADPTVVRPAPSRRRRPRRWPGCRSASSKAIHTPPARCSWSRAIACSFSATALPTRWTSRASSFRPRASYAALKEGKFSPRGLGERIIKAVKQHAAGRSQHDDITLVCFGRAR